jgi:hypothetical protein
MLGKSYSAIDSYRACFLSHDQEGNHIDGFCPKATYFSRGESIASFGNQVFISGPYFGDITISGKTLLSSGKPPLMEENSFLLRRDFGP